MRTVRGLVMLAMPGEVTLKLRARRSSTFSWPGVILRSHGPHLGTL
ncbi:MULTISPECIES: hypothetical protein [unclassified Streptomyces]|nr:MULTISPECIES: hypothetical protein [unclassified Streptomyces]MCX4407802.1 hypothetical protein [Streptomyces sp. NBC_01764]MCX5187475.1 hypothetical protein [Streptomyces sp. NBC_00268]